MKPMSPDTPPMDGRGQSYALEGLVAGLIVLAAIAVALQTAAVTPQSTSATNQRIEVIERTTAATLLDHAARNGSLRRAALFWNDDQRRFVNASSEGYVPGPPPNRFGELLERTFYDERVAVNVYVSYTDATGDSSRETMVFQGTPSNAAVSASHTLVLFDDDHLVNRTGPIDTSLNDTKGAGGSFYAPDAAPNSSVWNVVEVKLVVWRI